MLPLTTYISKVDGGHLDLSSRLKIKIPFPQTLYRPPTCRLVCTAQYEMKQCSSFREEVQSVYLMTESLKPDVLF